MFTELSEIDCVTSCDTGPGSAIEDMRVKYIHSDAVFSKEK